MAHNHQPESYPSSSDEEEEKASGSDDEQLSGSDDEQSSGSESEQKHEKALISPSQPPQSSNKSQIQDQSSTENEDSGSETDSDSPPAKSAVADPKIKPISSKPMVRDEKAKIDLKKPKKSESGSVSGSKTSTTAPPVKRPAPLIEKDAKKAKSNTVTDDDSKKQLFQRLWSEDDEIAILQGMIDYKNEKNGESPVNDMGAFHQFIKESLHVDVSRAQLVDKVRRLKKKYVNNASREKNSREKNGKDRSFPRSHEQKGYELSKLIWGGGGGGNSSGVESKKIQTQKNGYVKGNAVGASTSTVVKSNGVEVKEVSVMKGIDINRFVQYGRYGSPVLYEEIMKGGMELVEGSKREELEEKWKELKKQELQLYVKRMELVKQQALVVLEAVDSSEN